MHLALAADRSLAIQPSPRLRQATWAPADATRIAGSINFVFFPNSSHNNARIAAKDAALAAEGWAGHPVATAL